jgi:hypothetical protein
MAITQRVHDASKARFDQVTAVSEKSSEGATPTKRHESSLKNELDDKFLEMKYVVQGDKDKNQ